MYTSILDSRSPTAHRRTLFSSQSFLLRLLRADFHRVRSHCRMCTHATGRVFLINNARYFQRVFVYVYLCVCVSDPPLLPWLNKVTDVVIKWKEKYFFNHRAASREKLPDNGRDVPGTKLILSEHAKHHSLLRTPFALVLRTHARYSFYFYSLRTISPFLRLHKAIRLSDRRRFLDRCSRTVLWYTMTRDVNQYIIGRIRWTLTHKTVF